MQLRIGVLRSELERQRKALGRETDLRQKERAQLQKKGKRKHLHKQRVFSYFDGSPKTLSPHTLYCDISPPK